VGTARRIRRGSGRRVQAAISGDADLGGNRHWFGLSVRWHRRVGQQSSGSPRTTSLRPEVIPRRSGVSAASDTSLIRLSDTIATGLGVAHHARTFKTFDGTVLRGVSRGRPTEIWLRSLCVRQQPIGYEASICTNRCVSRCNLHCGRGLEANVGWIPLVGCPWFRVLK
jgi:hypothetical protein